MVSGNHPNICWYFSDLEPSCEDRAAILAKLTLIVLLLYIIQKLITKINVPKEESSRLPQYSFEEVSVMAKSSFVLPATTNPHVQRSTAKRFWEVCRFIRSYPCKNMNTIFILIVMVSSAAVLFRYCTLICFDIHGPSSRIR